SSVAERRSAKTQGSKNTKDGKYNKDTYGRFLQPLIKFNEPLRLVFVFSIGSFQLYQVYTNVLRAADLLSSIMLLFMTTNSMNYDLYFFSPALRSFDTQEIKTNNHTEQFQEVMNFLNHNFTIDAYASNFTFSDTEKRHQFLKRFLGFLESEDSVPQDVRNAVKDLQSDITKEELVSSGTPNGFIKPLPIYIFVRIATFLAELDYGLRKIQEDNHLDSVEEIIKYLTVDFKPESDGEGLDLNDGSVDDIVAACTFGFVAENKGKDTRLFLSDGIQASKKNKQLFEFLLTRVPESVKKAIEVLMPYL
ncbi:hypothetical protein C0J52_09035, partial [Blattella germanica]